MATNDTSVQAPRTARRAPRTPSFVHVTQLSDLIAVARQFPQGIARADLVESLSMGRNAVDRRLRTAVEMGLLEPAGRGVSTGGRAPEMWRFNPDAATILALSISYRESTAALMSIGGEVIERVTWDQGIIDDPQSTISSAIGHLSALRSSHTDLPAPWALGVCLPTPVDFRDGTLTVPVAATNGIPSWTGYPVRTRLAQALDISVWVDDEVNALALAAASRVGAPKDLLYIRLSLGLGMGIVSSGQVHRGAGAASGEISHIQMASAGGHLCRCGRRGCLETMVSGGAIETQAASRQALHSSPYLREIMSEHNAIRDTDVFRGVAAADRVCTRIVTEAVDKLAVVLAILATTYNPGEVVLGGSVVAAGNYVSTIVGSAVRRRALPVTCERLRIRMGHADDALVGACRLAADWILHPHVMHMWLPFGSPVGVEQLTTHKRQDA
ncbi:ROK family protein [Actinomyces urogenitalis]|uniref:ROK family protein n=1 Tax=Actinomyces urogenitalis TaxID=103621 RepID=UPI0024317F1C|nr:ROK family protein [Actinomyces urogenitalis]MCI7458086.1 ROK family protein [Actinomyces urogenitalis]